MGVGEEPGGSGRGEREPGGEGGSREVTGGKRGGEAGGEEPVWGESLNATLNNCRPFNSGSHHKMVQTFHSGANRSQNIAECFHSGTSGHNI